MDLCSALLFHGGKKGFRDLQGGGMLGREPKAQSPDCKSRTLSPHTAICLKTGGELIFCCLEVTIDIPELRINDATAATLCSFKIFGRYSNFLKTPFRLHILSLGLSTAQFLPMRLLEGNLPLKQVPAGHCCFRCQMGLATLEDPQAKTLSTAPPLSLFSW